MEDLEMRFDLQNFEKQSLENWQEANRCLIVAVIPEIAHRNVRRAQCDYKHLVSVTEYTYGYYHANYELPPVAMIEGWIKKAISINKRLNRWIKE